MSQAKTHLSKAQALSALSFARQSGWMALNKHEIALIETLRNTAYHGRNLVIETAEAMHRAYPWQSNPQGKPCPGNTATTFPANDGRFLTEEPGHDRR